MVDKRFRVNTGYLKELPKFSTKQVVKADSPKPISKKPRPKITDDAAILDSMLPENSELQVEGEASFHWHIKDWKGLENKSYSPTFELNGYQWRILLFPNGNNQKTFISVYLEVANSRNLEKGWHICGIFKLAISNPGDPNNYFSNDAHHRFSQEEVDWGFTRFCDISNLGQHVLGRGPFLVKNEVVISVFVKIIKDETGVLWHNFNNYDSRLETGYVGIKNQGATCYMNSILQSLYFTNAFRKAVYQIPTENDLPTKNVALALQRCFYNLQYSSDPVGTTELTKSFGWDSLDSFKQHDVQEFNRVLQDTLEEKMSGTPADGAISNLFKGGMKSYIKCLNVDFESSRVEDYYDIQLNVKGCKNVIESFDDYITVETLEGDNKYQAEGYGLQDANKGVIFETFPPVLHLQLKRFEYDFMRDTMVKINDRYEFPDNLNLDKYCSKPDENGPYDYELHGVLVHSGDISGGHYFALIRPDTNDKWYRFDDDRVTRATKKEVFEENYGDEPVRDSQDINSSPPFHLDVNDRVNSTRLIKKFTNAYMLVYIRKSVINNILGPVTESDIPVHLKKKLDAEQAIISKRKQDKLDLHLYNKIAVITDKTFGSYQGFDLAIIDDSYMEVSPNVDVFKVLKTDKVSDFRKILIDFYKLQPETFRIWTVIYRLNKTVRVDRLLSPSNDNQTIEKLKDIVNVSPLPVTYIKLYLEVSEDNSKPLEPLTQDQIIIFIKYFDIELQEMRGLGHIIVSQNEKLGAITPTLLERAGLLTNTPIQFFEEVKPTSIDVLRPDQTFRKAELQHGDIICFQKILSKKEIEEIQKNNKFVSAIEHYTAYYNRVCILFKPKPNSPDNRCFEEVKLILDRTSTYPTIAKKLATELNVLPNNIRFVSPFLPANHELGNFGHKPTARLDEILPGIAKPTEFLQIANFDYANVPVLYYEVLDLDVSDLEHKKGIEVSIIGPTLRKETKVTVFIPRTGSVESLIEQLILKGKMDVKSPSQVRLYEVVDGQILNEYSLNQMVVRVGREKSGTVYAEAKPKEELETPLENSKLIQVVHYHHQPTHFHSIPFKFLVIEGEPFEETKKRLQKRTGLGDLEWKKVHFTIIRNVFSVESHAVDISDDQVSLSQLRLQEGDALGLDRADKTSKSRFNIGFDKGIFIRG